MTGREVMWHVDGHPQRWGGRTKHNFRTCGGLDTLHYVNVILVLESMKSRRSRLVEIPERWPLAAVDTAEGRPNRVFSCRLARNWYGRDQSVYCYGMAPSGCYGVARTILYTESGPFWRHLQLARGERSTLSMQRTFNDPICKLAGSFMLDFETYPSMYACSKIYYRFVISCPLQVFMLYSIGPEKDQTARHSSGGSIYLHDDVEDRWWRQSSTSKALAPRMSSCI